MSSCQGRGVRALLATALLAALAGTDTMAEPTEGPSRQDVLEQIAKAKEMRRWECDGLTLYVHDDGKSGMVRGAGMPLHTAVFDYEGLMLRWDWDLDDLGGFNYSVVLDPAARVASYIDFRVLADGKTSKKPDATYRNCKGPHRE